MQRNFGAQIISQKNTAEFIDKATEQSRNHVTFKDHDSTSPNQRTHKMASGSRLRKSSSSLKKPMSESTVQNQSVSNVPVTFNSKYEVCAENTSKLWNRIFGQVGSPGDSFVIDNQPRPQMALFPERSSPLKKSGSARRNMNESTFESQASQNRLLHLLQSHSAYNSEFKNRLMLHDGQQTTQSAFTQLGKEKYVAVNTEEIPSMFDRMPLSNQIRMHLERRSQSRPSTTQSRFSPTKMSSLTRSPKSGSNSRQAKPVKIHDMVAYFTLQGSNRDNQRPSSPLKKSLDAQTMGELDQFEGKLDETEANRLIQEELACSPVRSTTQKQSAAQNENKENKDKSVKRLTMNVRPKTQHVVTKSRSSSRGKKKVQFSFEGPRQSFRQLGEKPRTTKPTASKRSKSRSATPEIRRKAEALLNKPRQYFQKEISLENRPDFDTRPIVTQPSQYVQSMALQIIKDKNMERAQEIRDARKQVIDMITDFKKKSLSKNKKAGNTNQSAVAAVSVQTINLSNLSSKAGASAINTTYDVLIQDRILQGTNSKDANAVRKKVVLLLIEVLKLRKTVVKTEHVKKAGIQFQPSLQPKMKGRLHADLKPSSIQQQMMKLAACEKLLKATPNDEQLRVITAHLLLLCYFQLEEYERILRHLETSTEASHNFKDLFDQLLAKASHSRSVASNTLHLLALKAESNLVLGQFDKAAHTFNQVCHLYNHWIARQKIDGSKQNITAAAIAVDLESLIDKLDDSALEFGIDDYIKARAGLAECYMNSGHVELAIEKFQGVKRKIQSEIVFDKPIMFINVCNQLGNCYLRANDFQAARENFEQSLLLIRKLEGTNERINDLVIAKIYLNLGIIAQTQGDFENSLLYHKKSLDFKLKELPELHEEVMSSYVMIAFGLQKAQDLDGACEFFEKALHICRMLHGDFTETTAYSMIQLADAYQLAENYPPAISNLQHAVSILTDLEIKAKEQERSRITLQLNKVHLQLVNLLLETQKLNEAQEFTSKLEARLEVNLEDQFTFKLFNELGNISRKHDNLQVAIQLYKKSLLSIKTRFKNSYLSNSDTSKILINIASTEFMRDNLQEALRYYEHALNVVRSCTELSMAKQAEEPLESKTLLADMAKIHVSLAQILRINQDIPKALHHFKKALLCLERGADKTPETNQILLEAKKTIKQLQGSD